jgi:hypothetical protein
MALGSFDLPTGAVIIRKGSYLEFPTIGNSDNLYIDTTSRVIYRWDSVDLKYYKDTQDFNDISLINGGNANG